MNPHRSWTKTPGHSASQGVLITAARIPIKFPELGNSSKRPHNVFVESFWFWQVCDQMQAQSGFKTEAPDQVPWEVFLGCGQIIFQLFSHIYICCISSGLTWLSEPKPTIQTVPKHCLNSLSLNFMVLGFYSNKKETILFKNPLFHQVQWLLSMSVQACWMLRMVASQRWREENFPV